MSMLLLGFVSCSKDDEKEKVIQEEALIPEEEIKEDWGRLENDEQIISLFSR